MSFSFRKRMMTYPKSHNEISIWFVKAKRPSYQFFSHVWTEPSLPGYYQYFSGSKCVFAERHNTAAEGIEPLTLRTGVQGSTTMPPRSPKAVYGLQRFNNLNFCTSACFGESMNSKISLQMIPTPIKLTGLINSEQNCIILLKVGDRKHWLRLPKTDSRLEPCLSRSGDMV